MSVIGTAMPGILFDLTGPGGYTAFSNAMTSSPLLDLPTAGQYTLTVHATQPSEGAYSFELNENNVTALSSGVASNGSLVGNGQSQLFTIGTTQDQELLIGLKNQNAADHIELFARLGSPPTPANYQYKSATPDSKTQTIVITQAAPGTWYILVDAVSVAVPPESDSLTATIAPIALSSSLPKTEGTARLRAGTHGCGV